MATSSQHGGYIDPWQEYRAILAKLKKRFLRKPNVAEAMREFVYLSNRFKDEECPHYAGYCHLAIARCESSNSNVSGEAAGLKQAARFFIEAEKDEHQLGLPTFHENLTCAMHCYGHAIKIHADQKQMTLAACLCLELGQNLYRLGRAEEAIEYFEKGARFFDCEPLNKMHGLEWLALCQAESNQMSQSLSSIDELWSVALRLCQSEPPIGTVKDVLRNCEIATIFLLLLLRSLPQHMSERQSTLMQMYTWVSEPSESLPEETFLNDDDFLLMQSFVLGVKWREAETTDHCLTKLIPNLNPFLAYLGIDLVDKLYTGDYIID